MILTAFRNTTTSLKTTGALTTTEELLGNCESESDGRYCGQLVVRVDSSVKVKIKMQKLTVLIEENPTRKPSALCYSACVKFAS